MLARVQDWPQRLSAECQAARNTPHSWGEHDCATFAADCVFAMTGENLLDGYRGRYTTAIGAARIIKNEGFDSLADMVASKTEPCAPVMCGRGDIVLVDGEHGEFLAVVMGHYAVAPGPSGIVQVSLKFAKRGFKV